MKANFYLGRGVNALEILKALRINQRRIKVETDTQYGEDTLVCEGDTMQVIAFAYDVNLGLIQKYGTEFDVTVNKMEFDTDFLTVSDLFKNNLKLQAELLKTAVSLKKTRALNRLMVFPQIIGDIRKKAEHFLEQYRLLLG